MSGLLKQRDSSIDLDKQSFFLALEVVFQQMLERQACIEQFEAIQRLHDQAIVGGQATSPIQNHLFEFGMFCQINLGLPARTWPETHDPMRLLHSNVRRMQPLQGIQGFAGIADAPLQQGKPHFAHGAQHQRMFMQQRGNRFVDIRFHDRNDSVNRSTPGR
ncbi:hypothetical protein [Thiomonas bhubaneswarensis]|uniref:hypothetical protein n=1 Tax=Thiomonas bhubaneswarensis TaxID=339866 RepID=UPI0012E238C4|nr:hypothetical protein [Thiomonas bhubaneswarensis]